MARYDIINPCYWHNYGNLFMSPYMGYYCILSTTISYVSCVKLTEGVEGG